ncbi:MAG: associated Golgi protein-like protein [Symbiobacteriaceae bacterium]|nr:associated Golgi protein-like protein [Symbiobacteriaceae bacterium]
MLETLFMAVIDFLAPFGYWGVAFGMFVESACIPLPSEIVLPFGGFLASQGTITFTQAVLAGQLGGLGGSILAYGIGRYGGRGLLERYGKYILISRHEMDVADRWFAQRGEMTVFLTRLLPGIRTFISLPAGIAGMNFGKFIFYSFLGMLPWSFLFTYAGFRLGNSWSLVRQYLHKFDLVIIVVLLAAVGWFIWYKLRRREA